MQFRSSIGGPNATVDSATCEIDFDLPAPTQYYIPWPIFAAFMICSVVSVSCAFILWTRLLVTARARSYSRLGNSDRLSPRPVDRTSGSASDGEQDVTDIDIEGDAGSDRPHVHFLPSEEEKQDEELDISWAAWLLGSVTAALVSTACGTVVMPQPPSRRCSKQMGAERRGFVRSDQHQIPPAG
ncbi:hypothetical protein BV20DRAFT_973333 [Pilatotrama ljubarskyi]|nr:hypothetical protein BV20DRAFT_973333 [Pilatotrama ljubarskyi]